jgi:hypothetical protein
MEGFGGFNVGPRGGPVRHRERLNRKIEIAREVQARRLPQVFPEVPVSSEKVFDGGQFGSRSHRNFHGLCMGRVPFALD